MEQLAQLRRDYLKRLPAELEALQRLAHDGVAAHDRSARDELHHRLHKLAGAAGTFGLPGMSVKARALEQRLRQWQSDPEQDFDAAARAELRAGVSELAGLARVFGEDPRSAAGRAAVRWRDDSIVIWLLESDAVFAADLSRHLESFNYTVRAFADMEQADQAARTERPDLLIVDAQLRTGAGDATLLFPRLPALAALDCPLVFISAADDFGSRVQAARLGAEGYFLRPLDVPRLASRIVQMFERWLAPPQRVLIVEDDVPLAEHYRQVLRAAGMQAEVLHWPARIMEALAALHPEIVLLDVHMPGCPGPDIAGVIRQHDRWASLPIVYLSAEDNLDRQIEALDRGADDFLTKPISDPRLVSAVRVRVERARQLDAHITRDSLTGLLKHANIMEAAQTEIGRARRTRSQMSLAILDIDHFKRVNDSHGHAVGDAVISSVAMLLRQRLRRTDLIGRYGGEEFVAVLPECGEEPARALLDDVRQRFAQLRFGREGEEFSCTLSAGFACTARHPLKNAAELLVVADAALYVAKGAGRNQVRS